MHEEETKFSRAAATSSSRSASRAIENEDRVRPVVKSKTEAALYEDALGVNARHELFVNDFHPKCRCEATCSRASLEQIMLLRNQVWGKTPNRSQRKRNLLALMTHLSVALSSNNNSFVDKVQKEIRYKIGSLNVCEKAFLEALKVCQQGDLFQDCKKAATSGVTELRIRKRITSSGDRGRRAIAWLVNYANLNDFSPIHSQRQFLPERKKLAVYTRYRNEFISRFIGKNQFYSLWKKQCRYIRCVKESSGFKRCETCQTLEDLCIRPGIDPIDKKSVGFVFERHLAQQMNERTNLDAAKDLAQRKGNSIVMIVDGMDQKKAEIPSWNSELRSNKTEKRQSMDKIGQVVIGVRVWYNLKGAKERLYLYVLDNLIQKDSNSTIECIHRTILDLIQQYATEKVSFPDYLRVNFDNASENKNQYVLGYLSDLTRRGIFVNVFAGFLYRGHTHSGIDQSFSAFAKALNHNRTVTDVQFDAVGRGICQEMHTKVIRLSYTHDWKAMYEKNMCNIAGITKPHQFLFWKDGNKCLSQYRMWSDTRWYPCEFIPSDVDKQFLDQLSEVMKELCTRVTDESGTVHDNVVEVVDETIPPTARVENENLTNSVEFLQTYPPLETIPGISEFNSTKEMQRALAAIIKVHADPTVSLFTDAEYDRLCAFIRHRIAYVSRPDLILNDFQWPVIVRTEEQQIFGNPYSSLIDQWRITDANGFASLSERDQMLIRFIRLEITGTGANFMRISKKKTAAAEKPVRKGKAATTKPKGKRKAKQSSSEESEVEDSSGDSEPSEDADDDDEEGQSEGTSDGSESSEDCQSDHNPKKRTRSNKLY